MHYIAKGGFLPRPTKRIKNLMAVILACSLCAPLALPLRRAAAQGECKVECTATVPATAAVGAPVSFAVATTATSCASAVNVEWDFGDGTPRGTQANTTHTYAGPGTYTWQMTATANTNVTAIDTAAGGYGEGAPVRQASFTVPTVVVRDPLGRGLFVSDDSSVGNFVRFINTTGDAVTIAGKKIEPGTGKFLSTSSPSAPNPNITPADAFDVKASDVAIAATGLAVSNDGNLLYISDETASIVWVYNISASDRTVFGAKLSPGNVGALAVINQDRLANNFLPCALGSGKGFSAQSAAPQPCANSGSFSANGNTYWYLYAAKTQDLCTLIAQRLPSS